MNESLNMVLDKPTISDVLASGFRNCRFMLGGEEVTPAEVFSTVGFLPPIIHEADHRASRLFGFSLKLIMAESRHALFGHRVHIGVSDWRLGIASLLAAQVAEEMIGMSLAEASREEEAMLDLTPIYEYLHLSDRAAGKSEPPVAGRVVI